MYLQIHEELPEHPKTLALCDALEDPLAWAYLIKLWRWCCKYAKNGDVTRYSAAQIEIGIGWAGERGKLYGALVSSGFIDEDGDRKAIHDWMEYTGKDIAKMDADRERKSAARARKSNGQGDGSPTPVQRTSDGHPPDGARTAPVASQSKASQDKTDPEAHTPRARGPGAAGEQDVPEPSDGHPPDAPPVPAPAPPPDWRRGLEERWRVQAGVPGISFPGITELADLVEAVAKLDAGDAGALFDRAIAQFKAWRETCSAGRIPALTPRKLVEHWSTVWELMNGRAPAGVTPPARAAPGERNPQRGRAPVSDWTKPTKKPDEEP